jgi:U3 small nucleolar RNA-associated protein 10
VLIDLDERFSSYRETLFSQTSLELNRQMMNQKENEKLNKSINSYLRHLSGHLLHLAARKTLEYLIRRYMYKTLLSISLFVLDSVGSIHYTDLATCVAT